MSFQGTGLASVPSLLVGQRASHCPPLRLWASPLWAARCLPDQHGALWHSSLSHRHPSCFELPRGSPREWWKGALHVPPQHKWLKDRGRGWVSPSCPRNRHCACFIHLCISDYFRITAKWEGGTESPLELPVLHTQPPVTPHQRWTSITVNKPMSLSLKPTVPMSLSPKPTLGAVHPRVQTNAPGQGCTTTVSPVSPVKPLPCSHGRL